MKFASLAAILAGIVCFSASAENILASSKTAALSGSEARAFSQKLETEINWHRSLPEAQAQARREGKLVFWMHMLGKLDGIT